jgi:UV DNA damage endonuclease
MDHVRLGYACINLSLGPKGRTSRTCRLSNATPHHLEELSRMNLVGLLEILRWNVVHKIKVFRISSGIIPLASHPKVQWPWRQKLRQEISSVGDFARKYGMRLSMHPGQYIVPNSPRRDVVAAAGAELSYHAAFLDEMGLTPEHKIILHVGGVYDDREASVRRFRENFERLPANVRRRLVLENDERSYGVYDVLDLCDSLGIPMVFDYLHHRAYAHHLPNSDVLRRVYRTWTHRDGRPEVHYSAQKRGARTGAHADMIGVKEFVRFVNLLPRRPVDVMLEAKAKDRALLRLRQDIIRQSSSPVGSRLLWN